MQDQLLQIMRGIFADRMIEDIRVLQDKNRTVARNYDGGATAEGAAGKDSYIPLVFGGPDDQDRGGSVADRAIQQILRGPVPLAVLRNPNLWILSRLTSISPASGPDVLSYMLFEPEFIDGALKAGIQDAEGLLNDHPDSLWEALRSRELRKGTCAIGARHLSFRFTSPRPHRQPLLHQHDLPPPAEPLGPIARGRVLHDAQTDPFELLAHLLAIARVLKPGGRLVIAGPGPAPMPSRCRASACWTCVVDPWVGGSGGPPDSLRRAS